MIYKTRANLAKKKISLKLARQNIERVIYEKELLSNTLVKEKYELVSSSFENIESLPLSYDDAFYKNLWDLAISIEEGFVVSSKNNLKQIEQNLFDSINQRETDKISTNVEQYKESIESLLDLNKQEGQNSMINEENKKNIKSQIEKATKDLQDSLRTGSNENLEKNQEFKQLSSLSKIQIGWTEMKF